MSRVWRIIALGALGVVVYDAIASALSVLLGFNYGWAVIGSLLLYFSVGFAAVKADRSSSGLRAGAVLGLVDATAGWAVSWAIGPGQVTGATFGMLMIAGLLVTVEAAIVGALGALAAKRRQRGTTPAV